MNDIYDEPCDMVCGFVNKGKTIIFLTKEQIEHLDIGLELSGNLIDGGVVTI